MASTDGSETANRAAARQSQETRTEEGDLANRAAPVQGRMHSSAPTAAQATTPPRSAEPEHASAQPATPRWQKYGTPLAVVLLAGAVVFTITRNWNAWEGGRIDQVTDDAYVWGDITPLSTKVAGMVQDVKVSDFQQVHKGQVLVQLDDRDFLAQAAQAKAAVEAARAAVDANRRQIELQDSQIARALAGVDAATDQATAAQEGIRAVQAVLVQAQQEYRRQEALFQEQSTTRQMLEQATANERQSTAEFASRKADLARAEASLDSSKLAVQAARRTKGVLESQQQQLIADFRAHEASLANAEVSVGYTMIVAPANGAVGERQVRPGQLVSPGTEVIPFIDKIKWVQANYRETQLTNIKVGDPAEIRLDMYPGKVFQGKVIEIAPASGSRFALLPPDNATGNFTKVVQRISVKIVLDDPSIAAMLRPGLSAKATVRTRR